MEDERRSIIDSGIEDENEDVELLIPQDDYAAFNIRKSAAEKFCWIPFLFFGIAGTVPWNFYINANEFWEYKFRDVNGSEPLVPFHRSPLQSKFESFLSIASMVPNMVGALTCALANRRFQTHYKIMVPMTIVFFIFLINTVLSEFNSDGWQSSFLAITLLLVAVMNCLNSYGQCSTMGFAGTISSKYMNSMMSGQAFGGVLASIARIMTTFIKGPVTESSRYYFISALVIIMTSIMSFIILSRTNFYKFNIYKIEERKLLINEESTNDTPSVLSTFLKIKLYVASIVIVFITTLAIFPSIAVLVISIDVKSGSMWTEKLFVPVTCFLLFNVGDFSGRCIANWIQLFPENNLSLLAVSIIRIAFIPLFMMCNAQPRHHLPVFIDSDWQVILLMAIFSLTNGYLASICMMYAPKAFKNLDEQELASVLMALSMASGIAVGAICSSILVILL